MAAETQSESIESNQVMNPVTGSLVDLSNPDSAIAACDDNKKILNDMKLHDRLCRDAVVGMTDGQKKTRRVRGEQLTAKVVMGDRYPVQSILKEAWNSFPQFRDEFLRISTVSLKMREFKKLVETASQDPAFNQFKTMLEAAYDQGSDGAPTVTLESSDI